MRPLPHQHPPMFTGLVEQIGTVVEVEPRPQASRIRFRAGFADLRPGESVAVDGACLTAVESRSGDFCADVSAETLARTTLGALEAGDKVNLERPLALGGRLGGHLVLGHVDGVGEIVSQQRVGDGTRLEVRLPPGLLRYVVEKGSIALDGISLTVNEVHDPDRVALFLIPETLRATTWGAKRPGGRVNVEVDMLAKHVARLLQFR